MKWSKYNYIFNSSKHGRFIFNSSTNSFIKISDELYRRIEKVKDWSMEIDQFDDDFVSILKKHNIVVEESFDTQFFYKKKYLRYKASFDPAGIALTVATTTNCNFRCPYCFEKGVRPTSMKRDVEDAILAYISTQKKPLRITWYGGEPLLNFGTIERITKKISELPFPQYVEYALITNGYHLDEKKCKFFAGKNFKLIQITIDGTEETHNKSRISKNGEPTYHVIINNIDNALKLLPETPFAIRVNIGKNNKNDYPIIYRELKERWKDHKNISIYFSFINSYGNNDPVCLNSREKIEYAKELHYKFDIPSDIITSNNPGVCNTNSRGSYLISPNGDLYKCWTDLGRTEKKVGTIFEPHKTENYNLLTHYYVVDKFNDPKCLECFLMPICAGGCPIARYTYLNDRDEICPYEYKDMDSTLEMMYEWYSKAREKSRQMKKGIE